MPTRSSSRSLKLRSAYFNVVYKYNYHRNNTELLKNAFSNKESVENSDF